MASGARLFEARGVGRVFADGTRALDGFDLAVDDGEFVSIVGPSGCGKSTLLRLIAGLDAPSAGALDWPGGRPAPGDIGFVFQDPTLMPWASVFDNVYLPLRLAGRSRREATPEIDAIIERVGLDGFAASYPRQLSGGMRMRASIARALVTRPRLLLMDEPFAAVDEITRFRLNDDLLRIWRAEGCTIVFVTHSVFEAVFLSSRVIVAAPRPGRVVADSVVDLPETRDAALRTSAEYAGACRKISAHLAEAVS